MDNFIIASSVAIITCAGDAGGALIPIDTDYMIRQAGLDLERVMHRIREGGLDLDDAQAAWERAMGHADEGITRGVREIRQARPSI